MADEVVAPEKVADLAESIGEEGTLASIQARTPRMRFDSDTGGLVEETLETADPEGKEGEGEAEAKGEEPEKQPEPDASKEEKKPKYKTVEEAEKAANEAASKMHEATTAAAQEKEAREKAERENAELKEKLETALAAPQETKETEAAKPLTSTEHKAKVRAATKAALSTIRELDRTDPEYDTKVEEAWADALFEAGMGGTPLTQAEIDKMVKASMAETKKAQEAADAQKAAETASERAWQAALAQGKKAGLDLDDQDSADYMLFDAIERRLGQTGLPDHLKGKGLPEVVDYIIAEVRKRTGKVVAVAESEKEKARRTQAENAVLTKGLSKAPEKTDQPATYSLAELQRADKERRIARQRGA